MSTEAHSTQKQGSDNISEGRQDLGKEKVDEGSSSYVKTLTAPIGLTLEESNVRINKPSW